ncbi:hypothetical protein [Streptomyces sp. NPDC003077]|uniref:hypothetical protein n=1 Tax=Streptomyces sp. NPDC003077 TaxID=3154443 RepID=UPI0033AD0103
MQQTPTTHEPASAPRATTSGSGRWLVRLGVLGATGLAACLSATAAHAVGPDFDGVADSVATSASQVVDPVVG